MAALGCTKAVTLPAQIYVRDEVRECVKRHFNEHEPLDLARARINTWSRLNLALRTVLGSYHVGMYRQWIAAAAASSG